MLLPPSLIFILELSQETTLNNHQEGCKRPLTPSDVDYPLLTELFFLAHAALRLAFPPLMALHMETNRQLHQLEQDNSLRADGGAGGFGGMMGPAAAALFGGGGGLDNPGGRWWCRSPHPFILLVSQVVPDSLSDHGDRGL